MEIEPGQNSGITDEAYEAKVRNTSLLIILEQAVRGDIHLPSAFDLARSRTGEELMVVVEAENFLLEQ